jgi:hypothetical protein
VTGQKLAIAINTLYNIRKLTKMANDTQDPVATETTADTQINSKIADHMLPLRDRIIKIETIINYHDKEFQNLKHSLSELSETVDRHQSNILERLEQYNKISMDVTYEQYRESQAKAATIVSSIEENKAEFDHFLDRMRAVSRAVWATVVVLAGLAIWIVSTGQKFGILDINMPTIAAPAYTMQLPQLPPTLFSPELLNQ